MRALRRLKREAENSEYLFVSERGSPFTTAGFAKLVERAGLVAAFNDAWLLIGGLVACSLLLLLVRTSSRSGTSS